MTGGIDDLLHTAVAIGNLNPLSNLLYGTNGLIYPLGEIDVFGRPSTIRGELGYDLGPAIPVLLGGVAVRALSLEAQAARGLATGADEAVFWSGIGRGGAGRAAQWAGQNGGTTLESLMAARGVRLPVWDAGNPASVAAWRQAATEFAAGARGNVRVLQGDFLRTDAIWADEFRALTANPNVTSIRAINPNTGAEVLLWSR